MTGIFYGADGSQWLVTEFISFDICHGLGEPCDYFEVSFIYESSMLDKLSRSYRFTATNDGETVFKGVVDEYTVNINDEGSTVTVSGRSLAALLLDNEAEAISYGSVTLDAVLNNHVSPYGIKSVKKKSMPPLYTFTVASGDSQWSVLKRYCRFAAEIQPRFSKDGVLVLNGEAGNTLSVDLLKVRFSDTRYGNISEVLVKNRVTGASYTVENAEFKKRGGCSRRVINVPRTSGYDSMRYTGQYQISEAKRGKRYVQITAPQLFAAFPADRIKLNYSPLGLTGTFTVCESHTFLNADGYGTELKLEV